MNELVLANVRVVAPGEVFRGTVQVTGGAIAAVDRNGTAIASAIDLDGDYLVPGLVDVHTDNLERHMLPRPSVRWPGMAALLSHDAQVTGVGITTVFDAVCLGIEEDDEGRPHNFSAESAAAVCEASTRGWLRAEHFLHLRCDLPGQGVAAELERYLDEPLLRMVSLMDHTPGQRQTRDLARTRRIVERQNGPLSNEEWESRLEAARQKQAQYADHNRRRILELMCGHSTPLASHDDTTVEHVEEAHASGIRICEFPTTLAAAQAARRCGMSTVMGSPNMGTSQSGNVSAREVAQAGLLDCLSSDYAPVSLLHAAFLLAGESEHDLPAAMAMVTVNPAALVGLHDRGAIVPGGRADLVRVQLRDRLPRVVCVWREGQRVA
jgi:alpha-D-ribose 1-methylphosphonate 5-triphosphate diphosphatase